MRTVRMLTSISGARNGEHWPPYGELMRLPDGEAADLVASRMAEYSEPDVEDTRTSVSGVETATVNTTPTRRGRPASRPMTKETTGL